MTTADGCVSTELKFQECLWEVFGEEETESEIEVSDNGGEDTADVEELTCASANESLRHT